MWTPAEAAEKLHWFTVAFGDQSPPATWNREHEAAWHMRWCQQCPNGSVYKAEDFAQVATVDLDQIHELIDYGRYHDWEENPIANPESLLTADQWMELARRGWMESDWGPEEDHYVLDLKEHIDITPGIIREHFRINLKPAAAKALYGVDDHTRLGPFGRDYDEELFRLIKANGLPPCIPTGDDWESIDRDVHVNQYGYYTYGWRGPVITKQMARYIRDNPPGKAHLDWLETQPEHIQKKYSLGKWQWGSSGPIPNPRDNPDFDKC